MHIIFPGEPFSFFICQKVSHSRCIVTFLLSAFKFSNPKSLSAKMRSSSLKYSTPLNNYIKPYLPVHRQMGFALSYVWSVWDCCWTGAEAVHGSSGQQTNFFTSLMPKLKHLSIRRSDQLVFQSKWLFSAVQPFLEIRYAFQHICFEVLGDLNHFLAQFPRHKRYHVWNMWNEIVKVFGWILSAENVFAYCSFSIKTLCQGKSISTSSELKPFMFPSINRT